MSLEAKFAALKIDEVSSIVDAVKADGVDKSGLAANISVLAARCESKDNAEALAAFKTVKALVEECPESQAFTKDCMAACKFLIFLSFLKVGVGSFRFVSHAVGSRRGIHWSMRRIHKSIHD